MGIIQGFRIDGDIGFVRRVVEAWHLTILGNSTTYVRRLVQCASSLLVFYVVWNTDNAQLHRLPYQEWNGDTHEAMAITPLSSHECMPTSIQQNTNRKRQAPSFHSIVCLLFPLVPSSGQYPYRSLYNPYVNPI